MSPVVPPYRRGEGFGSLGVRFGEVVDPAPVSLGPQTAGAWATLGAVALAAGLALAWLLRRHLRRRYRRAAARELGALGAAWAAEPGAPATLEAVPRLLKRCAMQSFGRARVAALSGEAWLRFLDATGPSPFDAAAGRALSTIAARGAGAVSEADALSLLRAARRWIRRHRAI